MNAVVETFDYAALAPDDAGVARAAVAAIRGELRRSVPAIGRHLLAVKAKLPHGHFVSWAQAELGMTARTAQNYMNAAGFLEGKSETLSLLPPTILYALAAPTTPPGLVEEIEAAAAAGAPLSVTELQEKLTAVGDAARRAKAQPRRSPEEIAKAQERAAAQQRRLQRERAKHEAQMHAEEEKGLAAARALVERFGAAGVRYLFETVERGGWHQIERHFHHIDAGIFCTLSVAEISAKFPNRTEAGPEALQ